MTPEREARQRIDQLLKAVGWAYREEARANRQSGAGFADYLLFNDIGEAVAVLEAKPRGTPPLSAKEQTRDYADNLGIRHVFLSNGDLHYHWVTDSGNPVRVMALPGPEDLDKISPQAVVDRSPLWNTVVGENFLRTRTMRYYQLNAVRAVQKSAEAGLHGFLLEMATGTGKTTVAAAICRLYLQAGVAESRESSGLVEPDATENGTPRPRAAAEFSLKSLVLYVARLGGSHAFRAGGNVWNRRSGNRDACCLYGCPRHEMVAD